MIEILSSILALSGLCLIFVGIRQRQQTERPMIDQARHIWSMEQELDFPLSEAFGYEPPKDPPQKPNAGLGGGPGPFIQYALTGRPYLSPISFTMVREQHIYGYEGQPAQGLLPSE